MKRIHLFEIEDQAWFPAWMRESMTRLIVVLHKLLDTSKHLAELIAKTLKETKQTEIVDLCSGGGGPMLEVMTLLKNDYGFENLKLTLTDLYPSKSAARKANEIGDGISYELNPVDATNVTDNLSGLRTMVCSFHHMKPEVAKSILQNAQNSKQSICIFEISDNRHPNIMSATAFPINIISALLLTPFCKPTFRQLIFTYLIPVIPIFFAWDGAVSNVRTYTMKDLDELLEGVNSPDYKWEKGIVKGKASMPYLIGVPTTNL